jgi:hypothetical protein
MNHGGVKHLPLHGAKGELTGVLDRRKRHVRSSPMSGKLEELSKHGFNRDNKPLPFPERKN